MYMYLLDYCTGLFVSVFKVAVLVDMVMYLLSEIGMFTFQLVVLADQVVQCK